MKKRLLAVAFGVGTVAICYALGKRMYGRRTGIASAALLAVMPYHVVVSRQGDDAQAKAFGSLVCETGRAHFRDRQRTGCEHERDGREAASVGIQAELIRVRDIGDANAAAGRRSLSRAGTRDVVDWSATGTPLSWRWSCP